MRKENPEQTDLTISKLPTLLDVQTSSEDASLLHHFYFVNSKPISLYLMSHQMVFARVHAYCNKEDPTSRLSFMILSALDGVMSY